MVYKECKIEGDSITLTKKELEAARNHYLKVADKFKPKPNKEADPRYFLYMGKADTLIDMLKMFESIDFV